MRKKKLIHETHEKRKRYTCTPYFGDSNIAGYNLGMSEGYRSDIIRHAKINNRNILLYALVTTIKLEFLGGIWGG